MDEYFEQKKREGLIFTMHNLNPKLPYISMLPTSILYARPVEEPEGPLYWSHLSGRYRTYEEQQEFLRGGCVDQKLPKICAVDT